MQSGWPLLFMEYEATALAPMSAALAMAIQRSEDGVLDVGDGHP